MIEEDDIMYLHVQVIDLVDLLTGKKLKSTVDVI